VPNEVCEDVAHEACEDEEVCKDIPKKDCHLDYKEVRVRTQLWALRTGTDVENV
jgi:hypothetical protein